MFMTGYPHVSQALSYQEKAVMSSERVQGIDHPQTIQDYVSTTPLSLSGCRASLSTLFLVFLPGRTLLSVSQTHLALYCFAVGRLSTSLRLLYRARYLTLLVAGEDHPQVALMDVSEGVTCTCNTDRWLFTLCCKRTIKDMYFLFIGLWKIFKKVVKITLSLFAKSNINF